MLGAHSDEFFQIQPGTALLLLEADNLLSCPPPESSPLRRDSSTEKRPVIWDSRKLSALSTPCIFVALKTQRFDTHEIIEQLLSDGHIVIAQDDALKDYALRIGHTSWSTDVTRHPNLIATTSSSRARDLLLYVISELNAEEWTTLAITGTNGKTSSTQITSHLLEELSHKPVLRLGTLGAHIAGMSLSNHYPTMPDFPGLLGALSQAATLHNCRQVVMEATSIGLNESRLGLWPVSAAAYLNLSQDHLDYHGTMANYLECKLELFKRHLSPKGHVIVNCTDINWKRVTDASQSKLRVCNGFGSPTQKDLFFNTVQGKFSHATYLERTHTRSSVRGISGHWTLWTERQHSQSHVQYHAPLLGDVQHENLAAAAVLMMSLGYPLQQIASACQTIQSIAGRLELVSPPLGSDATPCVLVDYAHSPDALEKTLHTCKELLPQDGRLICIFGCGGDRDPGKRPLMGEIAARIADRVWITSDNPRTEAPDAIIEQIHGGIPSTSTKEIHCVTDRKQAICEAISGAARDDVVLIAGKGHEDYQILGQQKFQFSDRNVAQEALELFNRRQTT